MDTDFFPYLAVLLIGIVIGFVVGAHVGKHKGAAYVYEQKWVCEVALGETHCGPAE